MRRTVTTLASFAAGFVASPVLIYLYLEWRDAEPPEAAPRAGYAAQITLASLDAADASRERLVRYVFGTPALPRTRAVREGDTLVTAMDRGFASRSALRAPAANPGGATLVVYHAGHGGSDSDENARAVTAFVEAGFTVVVMDMPLYGRNTEPVEVEIANVGTVPIVTHDELRHLDAAMRAAGEGSALRYFVEPVVAVTSWALESGYGRVVLVGFSGGGWTVTLAAALDTRPAAAYPIAGSVPIGLRYGTGHLGDWEQHAAGLYTEVATYEDLYVLGSIGRRHLQILNARDTCCFAEPRYPLYERAVQSFLGDAGRFEVHWDETSNGHEVSDDALRRIIEELRAP